MKSFVKTTVLSALAATTLISASANAHRVWVKPNTTVVSGEQAWVTFDAAVANGIFNPDHFAYGWERLSAIDPQGQEIALQNGHKLKYRSVFDLNLTQNGTYKVYNASQSLMARWVDAQGERQRWPGRGELGTVEEFNKAVPKDAKDLKVMDVARRVETVVTLGAPTDTVLKATNKGLELVSETHLNDLYVGESATMALLINGEPAKDAEITVVREGERYRDTDIAQKFTSNNQGEFEINFSEPGMYYLEAEYSDDKAQAPATTRSASYVLVFEVLPL